MEILLPDKEYFAIGEVAKIADVPQYVLRYWEQEFPVIRPQRRDSGHRKYTKKDVQVILEIKSLLYTHKYTIEGARDAITSQSKSKQLQFELKESSEAVELLRETKKTLQEIIKLLK